ncbi:histidinol-phosphate transaminase [Microvirga sp. VF16]|uniref:pyridoxal phosphate-dependent aminotransferase n=1 Tax=Microvirga sp. VF16 TaxID=2807101 RepID=UPI00193CE8D0|nr:histidinol-phosphate transaminase [Microvirga sp. VF16]QRM31434.1 aminotransferase class I/II-fold pyridoxal phosphate-dependent enzyme [Microvirga sp. VF16]
MTFERENVRRMGGYVPGEQPARANAKLNTNENPFPPCDAVLAALAGIDGEMLRRYPDPTAWGFRTAAARLHGLTPDHIVATNGGDELLRLALTTFLPPGAPLGLAEPGYSLYPVLAAVHDSPLCPVPLDDDWSVPGDIARRWNRAGARLAILVNPHAPSGWLTSVADLAEVARAFRGVLVVDEAYVDFVDPAAGHDTIRLVRECGNVLLLRTMSKGYSLAGLRLGYGIGSPGLVTPMVSKTKDSYNVDVVAQRVGEAALRHQGEAAASWAFVRAERNRMARELTARGFTCAPSQANFLLATMTARRFGTAPRLLRELAAEGIFVRRFDQDRLRDSLRISIGTTAENDALLRALDRLLRA